MSQIFGTCVCYFFYKRIFWKGKEGRTAREKKAQHFNEKNNQNCRHGFVGKCYDNMLSEFQAIWFKAADLELKMHIQLAFFLLLRKREKLKLSRIRMLWDYHTKGETSEESPFYITIGLWQLTWNRYKFPMMAAELVLWMGSFHLGIV